MTSALPEKTGVPKMLMPELFPARFHQVLDGICRTQRMMILYGDIVSQECGLPGMDGSINVSYGQDSRRMPLRSLIRDLKPSKAAPPETQNLYMVASLNRALAERRVAVRSTQPGEFSRFLTRMRLEKKLVMAVTTSFDASEAVHDPQMENKLAMLHGDNRQLRCYRKGCAGVLATDTHQLETLLLGTDHLEDGGTARLCPGCWKKYRKANKQVRVGNERTYTLRPPVEVDVTDDMLVGKGKEVLIRAAEECQLLLMVGISLKSQRLRELTQDLGDAIHANSGAVLYANPEPLKGRNLFDHIDFHVPLDPDQLIGCVLEQMDKRSAPGFGEVEPVNNEADFWTDIIGSQVMEAARALEQPYGGPCCRNCGCGVEGYLIGCRRCATAYCCRRVNYDESNEAQVGEDGEIVPLDAPGMDNEGDGGEGDGEVDTFELLDACIVLNQYSSDGRRPRLAAAKREFVCRSCWDCETQGLYPHYVKPSISLLAHPSTGEHTKLVMIIFYVEQFWPQAQHLTNLIAGRWETKGWPCFVKPIKLEHMEEQSSFERPYESGTYELFVVYITHGLTGDQGYQIAHGKALEPLPVSQFTSRKNIQSLM
ncbi:hypothetical protein FRC07_012823 [Ceratobasidium sp. 392]|nr:hypothetical protein FRC07_012823 [Ceratobasidium sp. 392]